MSPRNEASFFKVSTTRAPTARETSSEASAEAPSVVEVRRKRLKNALKSSLLPTHTLLFASNDSHKDLLETLLTDNKELFKEKITALDTKKDEDYEVLKELLILTALLGAKDVLTELKKLDITVDSEVLNMAIWSGEFEGNDLKYFTDKATPTYNSIRHAILSGRANVLEQILNENPHLKPNPEHVRAVDTVKIAAEKAQMQTLLTRYGVQVNSSANRAGHPVSVAGDGIENDSKEEPSVGPSMW